MKPAPPTAAAVQRAKRRQTSRWLAAFVVLPLGVWFVAGESHGFEGKTLSNFSLEPLVVIVASCFVLFAWTLVARRGLKPLVGTILLLILSAGAYAIQHFVPGLRE
jgi:cytochrome bd-type quinol oxidase subunit 2